MLPANFTFNPSPKRIVTDKRRSTGPAVQSMTGYAVCTDAGQPAVTVEMRGVNGRFLDLVLRLPDELRQAEPALRELLRQRLIRGKVECRVSLGGHDEAFPTTPNPQVLGALQASLAALRSALPEAGPVDPTRLLTFPGLFAAAPDPLALQARLLDVAAQALDEFVGSRRREGERLVQVIAARLDEIDALADGLRERVPALTEAFERKLTERIRQALDALPESQNLAAADLTARVSQEVSIYGMRADVAEEIDRLAGHVTECRSRLAGPGPVGKRLDFLMQELNREANTLASKAAAIDLTRTGVELKVLIEQIREQVQNLE